MNRAQFIRSLALLAAAPLALSRVLQGATRPPDSLLSEPMDRHAFPGVPMRDGLDRSEQSETPCAWHDGLAIKVPSNRITFPALRRPAGPFYHYDGPWDGTFKLERGCTNPAYVLADLWERQWDEEVAPHLSWRAPLNWQAFYDWGTWADELVFEPVTPRDRSVDWHSPDGSGEPFEWRPRFAVGYAAQNAADTTLLRESLSMHFRVWQATDPRYRRSWPGIPYPGEERA